MDDDFNIDFLTVEEVEGLHDDCMSLTPNEPNGVKDSNLLESAVMNPRQTWDGDYLCRSILEMAASYLEGLSKNHAFHQGNKRVAFDACSVFLRRNGYMLTMSQDRAHHLTLDVANGVLDRDSIVEILDIAVVPIP